MPRRALQMTPLGRLGELRSHPHANRMGYTQRGTFPDIVACVFTYPTRASLEAFAKDGSAIQALVKTPTPTNMLVNRNTQTPV